MRASRAAIRYAKATLSLAQDQNVAEAVDADMKRILNTLTAHEELQQVLHSPILKSDHKTEALKEIFSENHQITRGLLNLLSENKRISLLGEVAQKYIALYDQLKGKEIAVVTTAVPLNKELEKKILVKVKELTGNSVTIDNKIDESIIGGFILRVGDLQYNASIANKLNNLKRSLATK